MLDFKAAIVGGGTGGLAFAVGPHKPGISFEVYEQADELREMGAAVGLSANGTCELRRLASGSGGAVSVVPSALVIRRWDTGEIIAGHPIGRDGVYDATFGAPWYGVHGVPPFLQALADRLAGERRAEGLSLPSGSRKRRPGSRRAIGARAAAARRRARSAARRRVRVLQDCRPRGDLAGNRPGRRAVLLPLVAHPRTPARRRSASTTTSSEPDRDRPPRVNFVLEGASLRARARRPDVAGERSHRCCRPRLTSCLDRLHLGAAVASSARSVLVAGRTGAGRWLEVRRVLGARALGGPQRRPVLMRRCPCAIAEYRLL
jgi:hypothetical protein